MQRQSECFPGHPLDGRHEGLVNGRTTRGIFFCCQMAFMLSQMTPGWKEKYVAGMVALSGPWWGAPKGMRVLVCAACTFSPGVERHGICISSLGTILGLAFTTGSYYLA